MLKIVIVNYMHNKVNCYIPPFSNISADGANLVEYVQIITNIQTPTVKDLHSWKAAN